MINGGAGMMCEHLVTLTTITFQNIDNELV